MPDQRIKHDAYAVLKDKDFRYFLLFRFLMTVAIQMQSVIVGWQVYQITKDPLSLGLTGLFEAIPFIVVALYAGHVADRFDRKKVILWFIILFICGTVGLLFFSLHLPGIVMRLGILPVYFVVAVSGVARAFIYPSTVALMAQIVPRELYTNSSTWNSTTWQIGAISGPAFGGLIYGFFGVITAYIAVLGFMGIALLMLIGVKNYPVPPALQVETLFQRLSAGLKFVFKNQILFGSMTLDMFGVLFGGAVAMLPIFAAEVYKVGPEGLGFLRAAPMAGAVIMSMIIAYKPPRS